LSRPVTLILGPAGSGKTTLMAQWRLSSRQEKSAAWLSLDASDNGPARFWIYVIAALRSVDCEVGDAALRLLRAPGVGLIEEALPALLNDLLETTRETVLLLDDYHLIHDEQIHAAMAFFLEQLPGGHRVVLASRSQPPLPLASLRARGVLSEIDPGQLGFSESDAASLLNDVHGLGLGDGAVRRLHWRTEGWAAGLYLAALSLRGRESVDQLIESFAGSDRRIVDYLGAEVLDHQPGEVLTFLLRTSVLERLCGPLCDAVTGRGDGQEMLERIERSNAFLVPLDAHREWYRHHHLFAELLRHELGRRAPESVAPLHRKAAGWLLDAGLISEAVRQLVAAGDVDGAADVVVAHWLAFVNAGERAMVAEWLDAIPEERILTDGYLCVARAGLSAWTAEPRAHTTRHAEILLWLDHAERARLHSPADNRSVWLQATLLRASTWELRGDMGQTKQLAGQISPLDGSSPWHAFAAYLRGVSAGWLGDEGDAAQMLSATARLGRQHTPVLAVIAYGQLALIAADHENWEECEANIDAAFALIDEADLDEYWMGAVAHVAKGRLLRHGRRLREAEAELERAAVALGRRGVGVVELAYALLMLAEVRRELGDSRSARELVIDARERIANAPDPGLPVLRLLEQAERNLRLASLPRGSGSVVVEELTAREQAVLRLLPTGLSAREIGDELGVSRNTIKSHTKGLYRKLGATGRRDAVARGRELGLL
jgi:LuxR family transcriptional regulator, maltose regulon positive regulatory protein